MPTSRNNMKQWCDMELHGVSDLIEFNDDFFGNNFQLFSWCFLHDFTVLFGIKNFERKYNGM